MLEEEKISENTVAIGSIGFHWDSSISYQDIKSYVMHAKGRDFLRCT